MAISTSPIPADQAFVSKINGNERVNYFKIPLPVFKIFTIFFFIMHYGVFMVAHLFFIFLISFSPYILSHNGHLPSEIGLSYEIFIPFLMLLSSHGFSFFKNYIGKKEYLNSPIMTLIASPYARIILMHITLLFGGIFSTVAGIVMMSLNFGASLELTLSTAIISLFVILKIFVDIRAHSIQHSSFSINQ
jgi:hypothetical protein